MRNTLSALSLLTTLVFDGQGLAQAHSSSRPAAEVAPNNASPPVSPSSTTVSMRGTLERYDARSRTVTLLTSKGPVQFVLTSLVRIRRDGQVVDASSLQTLVGCRAVVRYLASAGTRTVESIHVIGKSKR